MRTAALVVFIAVCAVITAARVYAWSHPAAYAPGPLVPVTSTAPAPEQTITTWVTVTTAP